MGSLTGNILQQGNLWSDETFNDNFNGYVDFRSALLSTQGTLTVTYNFSDVAPVPVPAAVWFLAAP